MLHYDFLTSKDVNDLEYFEEYMTTKMVHSDCVSYVFKKDEIICSVMIFPEGGSFSVKSSAFKSCVLHNNSSVINKIRTDVLERYFYS